MSGAQRLDHIDGLRGIAALLVLLQHGMQIVHEAGHHFFDISLSLVNFGRFGVVLFFLISGCVIPFSFRGERPLRNFAVSRAFRLYPAYWLSILVHVMVALCLGVTIGMATILGNLTMLQGFWNGANIGFGYWTLTFEMAFYMLCAFLFWRGWLQGTKAALTIGLAMLGASAWPVLAQAPDHATMTPYCFALFMLGLVLRKAMVDGDPAARRHAAILVPATALTGAAVSGLFTPDVAWPGTDGYLLPLPLAAGMVLPIALFVAVLHRRPAMPRLAIWFGAISYSVYLFQDVSLLLLPRLISVAAHPWLFMALIFAVTIAIAQTVYRFVEQPAIALGRRLIQGQRRADPALALS